MQEEQLSISTCRTPRQILPSFNAKGQCGQGTDCKFQHAKFVVAPEDADDDSDVELDAKDEALIERAVSKAMSEFAAQLEQQNQ